MIDLTKILRPSILNLKAYSSARSLTKELKSSTPIFLDANEYPFAPEILEPWETSLNRYPSPQPESLVQRFSKLYNVEKENLLLTRGSDEAIDLLTRAVCEPTKDSILITPPTYGMYEVSADIQNIKTLKSPLILKNQEWTLDIEGIQKELSEVKNNIKIVYICSPNNPTGTPFTLNQIQECLDLLPASTLIVVDQAYCEFAPEFSVVSLLSKNPQLVILRTLSKAWGLAGLRLGALIAHPELISLLQNVRPPYPLSTPAVELALKATNDEGEKQMNERVKNVLIEKNFLEKELLKFNEIKHVYSSSANFLLVEFKNEEIKNKFLSLSFKKNIILRDRSSAFANSIRITIGSSQENQELIKCFKEGLNL